MPLTGVPLKELENGVWIAGSCDPVTGVHSRPKFNRSHCRGYRVLHKGDPVMFDEGAADQEAFLRGLDDCRDVARVRDLPTHGSLARQQSWLVFLGLELEVLATARS